MESQASLGSRSGGVEFKSEVLLPKKNPKARDLTVALSFQKKILADGTRSGGDPRIKTVRIHAFTPFARIPQK